MKISSRFTIAVHTLVCIVYFKDEKMTSNLIAGSVNVNPVIIRNILIQLQKADIITVKRGTGGVSLNRKIEDITLLDIFNAVESLDDDNLFSFHENPNKKCPVGKKITSSLRPKLEIVQKAMEDKLKHITLKDVLNDMRE
ncbi:Rrf2 family transcriptional regulator [Brachyspira sp. SAP_772]|uniref:Rrf2 family transcriptional regulator n=1 Tax=Brachyspira sp. SAP_772 TaxID=2608385 RepID=UPI0012F4C030|nr:Rrf2 family transcriptional regulator [Brachyspira sp. SAP_772]